MNAQANGTSKTVDELREEVSRIRLERQLKQEKMLQKVLEHGSYWPAPEKWGDPVYGPRIDEPGFRPASILVGARDLQQGNHFHAFRTWQDLQEIWAISRWLYDSNPHLAPILEAVANKVIATGFNYKTIARPYFKDVPEDWIVKAQSEIDRFIDDSIWQEWELEIFTRTQRDGDGLLREFTNQPVLQVRSIEPEQVVQPDGRPWGKEWAWGIHCDPQDEQNILGYWVSYSGNPREGSEVSADKIHHFKANVARIVRRGLSDFFLLKDVAEELRRLARNMRRGAGLLAAIAWIEQFESATKEEVEDFADNVKEFTSTNPTTLETQRYERFDAATVIRTGKGKSYTPPPLASQNTPQFVEICKLSRQALVARWNAPESLTGDASNGAYASLAVAESPFVQRAENAQKFYARRFKRVMWHVIEHAIKHGRLDPKARYALDIQVVPPPVIVRNRLDEASRNEILTRNGVKAPQTWAQEEGLKFEEQQELIKNAKEAGWTPSAGPTMPALPGGLAGMLGEGSRRPFPLWSRTS